MAQLQREIAEGKTALMELDAEAAWLQADVGMRQLTRKYLLVIFELRGGRQAFSC